VSGKGAGTAAIHAGRVAGRTVGPVIEKGSTVLLPSAAALYDGSEVTYGRAGLAAHEALIEALAELEGATTVRLFPSGLAAITGAMLALLKAGDEVLITDAIYKPTRRFCAHVLARFGVAARYFNPSASAEDVLGLATPATRLILSESPGSLSFEMQDVPAIARLARQRGVLTMMDNTWAAGFWFKPLDHGVDIAVQALTKYVGGHSDVFMGSAATADPGVGEALDQAIWDLGWAVSPEDAYQMLRGLRTLPTRLARHYQSGLAVANWLKDQPQVLEVLHPALPLARDHALWQRDYSGAAGLFAAVLRPSSPESVRALLDSLKVFRLGFSWGGFESLAVNADPQFGVRDTPPRFPGPILRLSVGLEDPEDLISDLAQGLAALD
jgi:cystathionine beta-lyase